MVDLSKFERRPNSYGGSEEKRAYVYNGKFYLVKMPDKIREKNNSLSYMNNSFSEYISCHIFESVNIAVQHTDLALIEENGKSKVAVVCEDFTDNDHILTEYGVSELDKDSGSEKTNPKSKELDINNIIDSLQNNKYLIDVEKAIDDFWKMFIIDALICNRDRHNGNWGFLNNKNTGKMTLAPVYDCGSSLFATYDINRCRNIINVPSELKNITINCYSAMTYNGKHINYYNFINSIKNEDCNKALMNIFPIIDLNKINDIIDNTPYLPDIYKEFYKKVIETSHNLILAPAYQKVIEKYKNNNSERSIEKNKADDFVEESFDL